MNTMVEYLPTNFTHAAEIMLASLSPAQDDGSFNSSMDEQGIAGWAIMPMCHYVGIFGIDHFDQSMNLFKELTKRFTAEFGIRFFLLADPEKTLATLVHWISDKDRHVRRLVSEGTRPRLPWAMQLPQFIQNPQPIIELLELLKDDEEEYVRRSVANSLNDISKDNPEVVVDIAERWTNGANNERKKLIRHLPR